MPKLSVVIPTLNRASLLAQTIERIEAQTLPQEAYEVVVVDNGSTDETPAVLEAKCRSYPNIRRGFQPKPGAAPTRNAGLNLATGDLILFIDDDILAAPDMIENHLKEHDRRSNVSVIGAVISPWDDRTEPFLRYLRDRGIFNPYTIDNGPMDFSYYHTGNVSTPRNTLVRVGGFNEDFFVYGMEDIELGYRLEKSGCRMVAGPDAKAVHHYFPTHSQFIERCELAGYSLGKMVELHPELRQRFVQNGRCTQFLKRFHRLYGFFESTCRPVIDGLVSREQQRGTGPLGRLLDRYYYWSVRYHFFLGYTEYNRSAASSGPDEAATRLARQRIPKLALQSRSKVSSGPILP